MTKKKTKTIKAVKRRELSKPLPKSLLTAIKKLSYSANITLAEKSGVPYSTLHNAKNFNRATPTTISKLLEALKAA